VEKVNPERKEFTHRASPVDENRNIRYLIHNRHGMLWQNSALRFPLFFT